MDRYEVPLDDHLAPLVAAARRGEEVVITENGQVAAVVSQPTGSTSRERSVAEGLRRLAEDMRDLPGTPVDEAAKLVRDMRDGRY